MTDLDAPPDVAPAVTYRPALRTTLIDFSLRFGLLLATIPGVAWFAGADDSDTRWLAIYAAFVPVGALVMALLFHHVVSQWPFTVETTGLMGCDEAFRPVHLAWNEIVAVRKEKTALGIQLLSVSDGGGDRCICMYTVGIDKAALYSHLARTAGPAHVLTRTLAP